MAGFLDLQVSQEPRGPTCRDAPDPSVTQREASEIVIDVWKDATERSHAEYVSSLALAVDCQDCETVSVNISFHVGNLP